MKYLCFFLISWSSFGQISLNDLVLWVKADSAVTYSLDNRVSEWATSNSNHNLVQSSHNNKPIYLENVQEINEKPSIQFNGGNWLSVDFLSQYEQPNTFFIFYNNCTSKSFS